MPLTSLSCGRVGGTIVCRAHATRLRPCTERPWSERRLPPRRALNVLSQADTILAEDCRHSRKLLNHYGIHGSLVSYHQHNEEARCAEVTAWLAQGRIVALISDAGTPGISDPGSRAVTAAIAAGHRVVPVPGACAAIAALVASGMPTEAFLFLGFLPPKSGARRAQLEHLRQTVSVRSPGPVECRTCVVCMDAEPRGLFLCKGGHARFWVQLPALELGAHVPAGMPCA